MERRREVEEDEGEQQQKKKIKKNKHEKKEEDKEELEARRRRRKTKRRKGKRKKRRENDLRVGSAESVFCRWNVPLSKLRPPTLSGSNSRLPPQRAGLNRTSRGKAGPVALGIILFPGVYNGEWRRPERGERGRSRGRRRGGGARPSAGAGAGAEEDDEGEQPTEEERARRLRAQLAEADELFGESRYQEALDALARIDVARAQRAEEPQVLWRQARALYNLAVGARGAAREASTATPPFAVTPVETSASAPLPSARSSPPSAGSERARLLGEALRLLRRALAADDACAPAHKWSAVLLDAAAAHEGLLAHARRLADVHHHLRRAVALDPKDPAALYMLGRWCQTAAELPWAQRRLARLLLGEREAAARLSCSLHDALALLERAEAAAPRFYSGNLLALGRLHLRLGRLDLAGYYLKEAAQYPARTDEDHAVRREALRLLGSLPPEHGPRAHHCPPKAAPPGAAPPGAETTADAKLATGKSAEKDKGEGKGEGKGASPKGKKAERSPPPPSPSPTQLQSFEAEQAKEEDE